MAKRKQADPELARDSQVPGMAIKYIGKKAQQRDTVADTGLVWLPGQVHVVPTVLGLKFLKHPDVWAQADEDVEEDPAVVGTVINSLPETPAEPVHVVPAVDLPNLQGMTEPDILAYAQREFHIDLDASAGKEAMIEKVIGLRNQRDTLG